MIPEKAGSFFVISYLVLRSQESRMEPKLWRSIEYMYVHVLRCEARTSLGQGFGPSSLSGDRASYPPRQEAGVWSIIIKHARTPFMFDRILFDGFRC